MNFFKKWRRRYKWDSELDKALKDINLKSGGHDNAEEGACMFEAFSWITGQGFHYRPVCVNEHLVEAGIEINDSVDDDFRQKLKPLLKKLISTQPVYKSGRRKEQPIDNQKTRQLETEIEQKGLKLGIMVNSTDWYGDSNGVLEVNLDNFNDDQEKIDAYKKWVTYADKRAKELGFK